VLADAVQDEEPPAYEVGDEVDEDLVLARLILGGILDASEASVGVEWAVSVVRDEAGPRVVVTTNEGRGWVPAGLYLPDNVSLPWGMPEMDAAWEGIADPARILLESAKIDGRQTGANLTALVSTAPIDNRLEQLSPNTSMEGSSTGTPGLNLSTPAPDRLDRLALAGGEPPAPAAAVAVARDTHVRVTRTVQVGVPEAIAVRRLREQVLSALESGRGVNPETVQKLRDADDLLATVLVSRRADVSAVAVGDVRAMPESDIVRAIAFERRCDEQLLLLADAAAAGGITAQQLRDIGYATGQVVDHPQLPALPTAAAAAPSRPVTVPTVAAPTTATAPTVAVPPSATVDGSGVG
jgi:hypothetical protein